MKKCTVIDNDSGEILNEQFNIDELEDIQRKKDIINKKKSDDEFKIFIDENLGNFYFLFYKLIKKGIERQYIVRFVYLCTYMNYENKLLFGNSSHKSEYMREKDLKEVLKLSETETFYTKKVLLKNELIFIENDIIKINKKYCLKGSVPNNKKRSQKVRIFETGLKELYEKSKPKEHKKLALLIELLPYINLKYNIICEDQTCENIKNIKPLNLKAICQLVKYSSNQSSRLKKNLLSLKIDGELVVMFSQTGLTEFITINPKIYYKGNKLNDLKWLIDSFEIKSK